MNGIDTAIASLLASRVDSLLNIAPGAPNAAQTGASALSTDTPVTPGTPEVPAPPPASAQTVLSAVALTLNAIVLSGGEATPAILGQSPIWPAAPALDPEITELPLFEILDAQTADAVVAIVLADAGVADPASAANAANVASTATTSNTTSTANPASASATTAATSVAPGDLPVAALAAALEQTVAGSGLFYEAHLAQWLAGQLSPADLASEPQNRLLDSAAQLPLDWASDLDASAPPGSSAAQQARPGSTQATQSGNDGPEASAAARATASIQSPQAARFAAGEVLANSLSDLAGQPAHAALHAAASQLGETPTQTAQSMAGAVNVATIPLVRQQLDMLATGQFRWSGEAWPGAKIDWTIQQDGDEWERGGGGAGAEEDYPWRTRLTLSLPLLGTVDAELTLTGNRLAARVAASPLGAARLAEQSDNFRERLAAAGIELSALAIREIGGGVPGAASGAAAAAAAQAAASAYARAAPAVDPEVVAAGTPRRGGPRAAERPQRPERSEWPQRGARQTRPERAQWPTTTSDTDFDWDM
ncbi:flagellar hook-length control protein FliK [Paraburkholderia phenazinium]|uniref:Hook-length control protein FliK n=1 Tax=Paraburkholderia phenazinium TaxID=60549 RepID=A0A1N6EDR6_9BURK|nr:flagellar hook-length control protein FliK [Paraburkholderia phenazinium]SIN81154.1 hook-length control protein FliK [Paraburkholderia phenazinium]